MPNNKKQIWLMSAALTVGVNAQAELIISEYIEGSSYNKALELYNPTDTDIDLNGYKLENYYNGNSSISDGNKLELSGTIPAKGYFVVANDKAVQEVLDRANITTNSYAVNFNGDDAIVLTLNDVAVDSLGQVGFDPGSAWSANGVSTKDRTLRRTDSNGAGDADPFDSFDPSLEWTSFAKDSFDDLGGGDIGTPPGDMEIGLCGEPATFASLVQGTGDVSPLADQQVIVEAIVSGVYQGGEKLNGYFVVEDANEQDSDPQTSEGLFIYSNEPVAVGEKVRVLGTVTEYFGFTELTDVIDTLSCGHGFDFDYVTLNLPLSSQGDLESLESMPVVTGSDLVVNDVYNLARYGEMQLGSQRHFIGTEVAEPGADALAISEQNALDRITLDDGSTQSNPNEISYLDTQLSASTPVRLGSKISPFSGFITYGFEQYRIHPLNGSQIQFIESNARQRAPVKPETSNFRVAGLNVLNLFNGDGMGGGFPTPRGAHTIEEYERQIDKLVSAIIEMDADVIGLMELENDGNDGLSAIAQLADAVNTQLATDQIYAPISMAYEDGQDQIKVGMLYRPAVVEMIGATVALSSANSPLDENGEPLFNDYGNRPALTQSFRHIETTEELTVSVNHLRAKGGSTCDPDLGDGQGKCNLSRTRAAEALTIWLAGNPTGIEDTDVVVIGDLNSYSKEDPIKVFTDASFTHLTANMGGHSYVYRGEAGRLDHGLVSAELTSKVVQVADWNINADEPRVLDYNMEYKTDQQIIDWYQADPYRSSDHDPLVIDFEFENPNQLPVAKIGVIKLWRWWLLIDESYDTDGEIESSFWQVGDWIVNDRRWMVINPEKLKRRGIESVSLSVTDNLGAESTEILDL